MTTKQLLLSAIAINFINSATIIASENKIETQSTIYGDGRVFMERKRNGEEYKIIAHYRTNPFFDYGKSTYIISAQYPIIVQRKISTTHAPKVTTTEDISTIATAEDTYKRLEQNNEKPARRYFSPEGELGEKTSIHDCAGFYVISMGDRKINCDDFGRMFRKFQKSMRLNK